jgi:hypothetical protein
VNMIQNDKIAMEYGSFSEIKTGVAPIPYKPTPAKDDYIRGYVPRYFAKKVNEDVVVEIQFNRVGSINTSLYVIVTLNWRISGPKESIYTNGIMDKYGVKAQNLFSIETVKTEQGVDLYKVLPNPLEFWQGR